MDELIHQMHATLTVREPAKLLPPITRGSSK
jgi:hypothetical protein